ncbi:MAG: hypothetical protein JWO05_1185 [Gemmatimonadetes bacterium]|nr:hypothetical protein [Gemmatimonadota bacterium]
MNPSSPAGVAFPAMNRLLTIVAAATVAAIAPHRAHAQMQTLDEGTFIVSRNGVPAGRESFRIVRAEGPGGQLYKATAQLVQGERRAVSSLGADSAGGVVSYDVEVRERGEPRARLQSRARPGRFSILLQTPRGESSREIVVESPLVLEDELFHQYYFVALNAKARTVTAVVPLSRRSFDAKLEERGPETIEIGSRSTSARHWALVAPGGASRDFWVDSKGRVLKVLIPETGLSALRDELPR